MLRREFIAGLGSAAALPVVVRAQQPERMRHIGVLMPWEENDPEGKRRHSAFIQSLADLGWTDGRNVRIDLRWAGGDINRTRALAHELVGMQPDIIVPMGLTVATLALQRETRTIPIVFASVADPIASGIVAGLDRPSGNITGFANLEASLGGKLLELLLEIAPGLKRAAIIFNPDTPPYRFLCAHLRRRSGHSSSCQSLRPFTATQRSKRPLSPLGTNRETASSSCRMCSRRCIAHRSYRRRPEIRYPPCVARDVPIP